jgi:hypothetical protein
MKYSKLGKKVLKWILPLSMLLILTVLIYYIFFSDVSSVSIYNSLKEGYSYNNEKMNYNKFKQSARLSSEKYKVPFQALNNFFGKKISKQTKNRYIVSDKNKSLKLVLGEKQSEYKITKKDKPTLELIKSKVTLEQFSTFVQTEGMGTNPPSIDDTVEFTAEDFELFQSEKVLELKEADLGYSFITDPSNKSSLYIKLFGQDGTGGIVKELKGENSSSSSIEKKSKPFSLFICTSKETPSGFTNSSLQRNFDYEYFSKYYSQKSPPTQSTPTEEIKPMLTEDKQYLTNEYPINQQIFTANYVLKKVLDTQDQNSKFFTYIFKNNNLKDLLNNVIDIMDRTDREKQIYIWSSEGSAIP